MELSLVYDVIELNALKPSSRNARTHDKRQIRQIADSIRTFGFTNPLLVDENNGAIAGHVRLEAARDLGLGEVPIIRITHLDDAQKKGADAGG